jgi:dolichyl-phosphate-mannose-protein mannosyltransferase
MVPAGESQQDGHRGRIPILGVILLVGAVARLVSCRAYVFQDEVPILINVAHFVARSTIIPSHFSYPTLFSYLVTLPTGLEALLCLWTGVIARPPDLVMLVRFESLLPLLAGRLTSVAFGVAMLLIVARIGTRFFSREVGLLGASLLAMSPLHVACSARALPDATAACFAALCLYGSLAALEHGGRWFPLAGAAAGLAASTKYNAALSGLAVVASYAMRATADQGWRRLSTWVGRTTVSTALAFIAAFLCGSPGWLLQPRAFWDGLRFEQAHVAVGHLGAFGVPYLRLVTQLWISEGTTALVFGLGVVAALWRPSRTRWVLLALVVVSFLYVGSWAKQSLHYLLFLYPPLALLGADAVLSLLRETAARRSVAAVALAAVVAWPCWASGRVAAEYLREDSRWRAARWIEATIPAGRAVIVDWSYVPRLVDDSERDDYRRVWRAGLLGGGSPDVRTFNVMSLEFEPDWLRDRDHGDYLVTSDYCYERFITGTPPPQGNPLRAEFVRRQAVYAPLLRDPAQVDMTLMKDFAGGPGPRVLVFRRLASGDSARRQGGRTLER